MYRKKYELSQGGFISEDDIRLFETEADLTEPGQNTPPQEVFGYNSFLCQYTVANRDTSVSVRLEGSLDMDGDPTDRWFNLDATGNTTHTANGTYAMKVTAPLSRIRFVFASEVGGTAATISARIIAAR